MKKISIIGATIYGNRGAEAMLTTVIGRCRMRYADSHFYVYSYYPRADKKLVNDSHIIIHSATPFFVAFILCPFSMLLSFFCFLRLRFIQHLFPAPIRDLAESNALVDIAGVSFIDGREKFLPYNVLTILPAFVLRVPVYKFSQALGPFRNKLNRFLAKRCLKKCTRIFARGAFTLKNLRELDVPSAIYAPASDVAFSQKQGDSPSRENENVVNEVLESLNNWKNEKKQIIGICPSSVVASKFKKAGQDYVVFLKAIIEGIIQKGHRVMLFPNATREKHMGRMRNNDLAVIKLLTWYLNHLDAVLAVQKDINTDSIKCLIEKCDITVVSRFHSMVNSLERAVPPLVLGWGHKYLEVMEQFGQEEWVLDYSENDPSLLLEKVFTLLAHKNEAKEQIKKNLPEAKRKSFSQFEILFDGLNEEKQSIFL